MTIEFARQQQIRAAQEIAEGGWNERQAVLGMGDWFAEEFILSQEVPHKPLETVK